MEQERVAFTQLEQESTHQRLLHQEMTSTLLLMALTIQSFTLIHTNSVTMVQMDSLWQAKSKKMLNKVAESESSLEESKTLLELEDSFSSSNKVSPHSNTNNPNNSNKSITNLLLPHNNPHTTRKLNLKPLPSTLLNYSRVILQKTLTLTLALTLSTILVDSCRITSYFYRTIFGHLLFTRSFIYIGIK
jgi:hypothetical protein